MGCEFGWQQYIVGLVIFHNLLINILSL